MGLAQTKEGGVSRGKKQKKRRLALFRGSRAELQLHPLRGIDVDAVYVENPVQMRAGGAAGGTGIAENIAALNRGARSRNQARHVQVHRFEALAVVDPDGVAENVKLSCEGDSARGHRAYRLAFRSALIDAAVVFAGGFAVVEALDAERRSHATADGRSEGIRPGTRIGNVFLEIVEQGDFFRGGVQTLDFGAQGNVLRRKNSFANANLKRLRRVSLAT